MKTPRLLLSVSAAAAVLFLISQRYELGGWTVFFKVLGIFLLAVIGFRWNILLGTALAFSMIGDFILGVKRIGSMTSESLFLLGLVSFLFAHFAYVAMFRKYWGEAWWKPTLVRAAGVLAILLTLGTLLAVLRPTLGTLLVPVTVYSLVLCAMGTSAMLADLGTPLAATGALSFIASDAMLAIAKFRGPFFGNDPLIWITYYVAQLLIVLGILRARTSLQAM